MGNPQEEMLKRIGSRIRKERNRIGLSLEAFAQKVGISKMTLHRIETGAVAASIVTLTEISFQLKQPVEDLIRAEEPTVKVFKKDEQESLFDPNSGIKLLAPKGLISENITITGYELEKGTAIEPHENKGFEWAYIMEGKAQVEIGDNTYPLSAGDAIFYDAHYPHGLIVEEKLKYVMLFLRDQH